MRDQHSQIRELIEAYFAAQIRADDVALMRDHVRDCDACRAFYDAKAATTAKLLGPITQQRLADAQIWQAVGQDLDSLDLDRAAMTSQKASQKAAKKTARWGRWWPAFVGLPAASLALAMGFAMLLPQNNPQAGAWTARGADPQRQSLVGLGVAALADDNSPVRDARWPRPVSLSDRLRLSYSNQSADLDFLFIFGVDDDLQPYWYYPLPDEGQSLRIKKGPQVLQQNLPYDTALRRRHHGGRLRVVALFSPHALRLEQVAQRLQQAKNIGQELAQIVWPDHVVSQIVDVKLVDDGPAAPTQDAADSKLPATKQDPQAQP